MDSGKGMEENEEQLSGGFVWRIQMARKKYRKGRTMGGMIM